MTVDEALERLRQLSFDGHGSLPLQREDEYEGSYELEEIASIETMVLSTWQEMDGYGKEGTTVVVVRA